VLCDANFVALQLPRLIVSVWTLSVHAMNGIKLSAGFRVASGHWQDMAAGTVSAASLCLLIINLTVVYRLKDEGKFV